MKDDIRKIHENKNTKVKEWTLLSILLKILRLINNLNYSGFSLTFIGGSSTKDYYFLYQQQ